LFFRSALADPTVENVAEGPAGTRRRTDLGHDLAVHVVEAVKAKIAVAHHHEAGAEAVQCGEPGVEVLAAAVPAAEKLDRALTAQGELKLSLPLTRLPLDAHGEGIESTLR